MGNTNVKPHPRSRNKKQVHWKAAVRPSPPGKPFLVSDTEATPDVVTIRWAKPTNDGGSPITGYLVEHKRTGSPHWVRATPLLVQFNELTLSGLEPGWRYQFRVSAENAVGMSDHGELSEPLTVTLQRSAITAPRFTDELQDTVALENEKVEFETHFLGQPPPKICWFKDGFEIFSSRRTRILTENDKSVLTIHQSALGDEGEIKCTATNRAGHASTKAKLTLEAPPSIRLPRNYEDGLLFELGEMIRLKVSIAGRPPPLIFWSHNGESINNGDKYEIETTDRTSVLKVGEATRGDRGEYQIKAVNKLGQDVSSFLVTVTDKPSPPGKARVVMTLGRSVTLSWSTPRDDGGCKIGNYIVEYYRIGWNMWLKAATSRQLTTILGDLIEGSEYKFRVKAESPYGISDPSEESETVFIPDPKRGILTPQSVSKSRDILDDVMPVATKRRPKQLRSHSSSRAEGVVSVTPPPLKPERTKIKSPPTTPELSPTPTKRVGDKINANIFDRSSLARELAYGSPEIKVGKLEERSLSPSPVEDQELRPSPDIFTDKKVRKGSLPSNKMEKSPSPITGRDKSPILAKESSKSPNTNVSLINSPNYYRNVEKSPTPTKVSFERSPSPTNEELRKSPNATNKQHQSRKVINVQEAPPQDTINVQVQPQQQNSLDMQNTSPISVVSREKSPSPRSFRDKSPSPFDPNKPPNRDNFTGSSEFMLVLYPDGNYRGQGSTSDLGLDYDENMPPPMSLSAPELGVEPPQFEGLKASASSTELLHERAMIRFFQAAQAEEAELERKRQMQERRQSGIEIPKIQINSKDDEDIVGLERKHSLRRRLSAGGTVPQHILWAQRRHSLRNSNDLSDIVENKLQKGSSPLLQNRREMTMHRQRSESEEREEQEFERVRAKTAKQSSIERKTIKVVEEEKWEADYEESISEEDTESSGDERLYEKMTTNPRFVDDDEEEDTYHPGFVLQKTEKKVSDAPFEILTKPNPLPDPNFIPKPILKKRDHAFPSGDLEENFDQKTRQQRSFSLVSQMEEMEEPINTPRKRSFSLIPQPTAQLTESSPKREERDEKSPIKSISAVAQICGMTAASIVIPDRLLNKRKDEEEAKVVIDHYGDIVRSYGQKKTPKPPVYLDRDELKKAAEKQQDEEQESGGQKGTNLFQGDEVVEATSSPSVTYQVNSTNIVTKAEVSAQKRDVVSPKRETSPMKREVSPKPHNRGRKSSLSRSPSRGSRRTPSKSPTRLENWSNLKSSTRKSEPSPMRRKASPSPIPQMRSPSPKPTRRRKASPSPIPSRRKTSPSPLRRRASPSPLPRQNHSTTPRPKMREIMTQTSIGLESFSSDSLSRTSTPIANEEIITRAEVRVRTLIDYVTDLAMFIVACWLYAFKNELLAIPVLLVMVYRQLKEEIRRRIPKWILSRFKKKET